VNIANCTVNNFRTVNTVHTHTHTQQYHSLVPRPSDPPGVWGQDSAEPLLVCMHCKGKASLCACLSVCLSFCSSVSEKYFKKFSHSIYRLRT